eukprot:4980888-Lingulodinium_polyedra.AAC.1
MVRARKHRYHRWCEQGVPQIVAHGLLAPAARAALSTGLHLQANAESRLEAAPHSAPEGARGPRHYARGGR